MSGREESEFCRNPLARRLRLTDLLRFSKKIDQEKVMTMELIGLLVFAMLAL